MRHQVGQMRLDLSIVFDQQRPATDYERPRDERITGAYGTRECPAGNGVNIPGSNRIMVGRSETVTGPYADRSGTPMMKGGGTLVLEGTQAWRGPGGQHVLLGPEADLLVFHAYDGVTGRPSLQISTLAWDEEGWPVAGSLPEGAP